MDDVQPPTVDPVSHRAPTNAGRKQLPPRDHSVLPLGQSRDQPIDATNRSLSPYDGPNVIFGWDGRELGPGSDAWGALFVTR
jgi:hypothetical protein